MRIAKSILMILIICALVTSCATKIIRGKFISLTVMNHSNSDMEVIISDGERKTGSWLAANRSKTEGFGPLALEKKVIVSVKIKNNKIAEKTFTPDLGKIPRMGKYPELVFIIDNELKIQMGYMLSDIEIGRQYLEIEGESKGIFDKRVIDADFVYYSGWGTLNQIKQLIKNGADVNARNDFGMSGLMMAVSNKKIENAKFIMGLNPDKTFRNKSNYNVFALATGNQEIEALLNIGHVQ